MKTARTLAWLMTGLALVAGPTAQEVASEGRRAERVELHVTAIAGDSAYLDQGANAGLAVGDRVRILPLVGASLEGTVRVVSSQAARAEFPQGLAGVQVGDRAEAYVSRAEATQVERPLGPEQGPVHPPWEAPATEWPAEAPLLAPVAARGPNDRPQSFHGKAHLRGEWGEDTEGGSDHTLFWAGAGLEVGNPFNRGGELEVDLDAYARRFDDEEEDDDESRLRVERLSYREGGVRGEPRRIEVGRFLPDGLPELGVLDGFELGQRLPSGDTLGFSVGFLPAWDDAMASGDNLAASVFYRFVGADDGILASTLGLQKTWFEGASDRDLVLWTGDYRPFERTTLHGSAWVDLYSSGDERSGADLTQALFSATQGFDSGGGLGLTATHYAFPELKNDELFDATDEELQDTEVSRVSVRGWHPLSEELTGEARVSAFQDQDDSGVSYELGLTARDLLYEDGAVSLDVYDIEGKFASGVGVRTSASKSFSVGDVRLELDLTDYEVPSESLAHDLVRALWQRSFGTDWSVSLNAEQRFGDDQSSSSLGFSVQRRF